MSSYNWGRRYGRTASLSKWVCFAYFGGRPRSIVFRENFSEWSNVHLDKCSQKLECFSSLSLWTYTSVLTFLDLLLKSLCHKLHHLSEDLTGLLHIIQAAFQMQKRGVFLIVVTRGLTGYVTWILCRNITFMYADLLNCIVIMNIDHETSVLFSISHKFFLELCHLTPFICNNRNDDTNTSNKLRTCCRSGYRT